MLRTRVAVAVLIALAWGLAPARAATRVTILVDAFARDPSLRKDWGFAALVEHDGSRILFDTGNQSELFRHNVEALGVDLRRLDFVVISHRHGDHTDGLRYLLSVNPGVKIYVADDEYFGGPTPPAFFRRPVAELPDHMRYFDGRVPASVPQGSPWKHANTQRVAEELQVAPGIRLVSNVSRAGSFTETPELSLALDTAGGQLLVVGCSHPGIEQILESVAAKTKPVRLVIGGLHWVATPDGEIERLAHALRDEWKVAGVGPGHCTSEPGFAALRKVFGSRYVYAGLGSVIALE